MVIIGLAIVLLASLINDWCAAHTFLATHPTLRWYAAHGYHRHGQRVWIASIVLFVLGSAKEGEIPLSSGRGNPCVRRRDRTSSYAAFGNDVGPMHASLLIREKGCAKTHVFQ